MVGRGADISDDFGCEPCRRYKWVDVVIIVRRFRRSRGEGDSIYVEFNKERELSASP